MNIQINTDKHVEGGENLNNHIKELLKEKFNRFSDNITRVEVHLSDANGDKGGAADKRCFIEVRPEKINPLTVTEHADTIHNAIEGASKKMVKSLDSVFGKITQH